MRKMHIQRLQNISISIIASCFVFLSISCSPKPSLKGVKPEKRNVESTVSTVSSGTVNADQEAVLNFGVIGKVEKINVKLGDTVKKGQVLAVLDNRDSALALEQAKKDLETSDKLLAEGLISASSARETKRMFELAKINYDRSILTAPFDGLISELNLQIGELSQSSSVSAAAAAKALIRVVDTKPRVIRGNVDELDLSKVKVGAKARVRIQSLKRDAYPAVVTKVVAYISTSKEQERTAQVELKLEDQSLLAPAGASADIEIVVDQKKEALSLPARAVLGTSNQRYVFKNVDGRIKKANIKTGIGNYEAMEILEGVAETDVVVFPSESVELEDNMKVKVDVEPWPLLK